MQSLPSGGSMAATRLGGAELQKHIDASGIEEVNVAAYNGPESSVMAGTEEAVKSMCAHLSKEEIQTKELTVSHAFHSHLMDPILDAFESFAKPMTFKPHVTPVVSNLNGAIAEGEMLSATYWRNHIREPVAFEKSVKTLADLGVEIFCEMGPHTQLMGMGRACVPSGYGTWLPSLNKKSSNGLI